MPTSERRDEDDGRSAPNIMNERDEHIIFQRPVNGAGDTWTPTWLNLFCFWLWEIPLAWLLARHFNLGPQGVAWAVTIAFSTLAVASAVLFRQGRWKLKAI